MATNSLQDITSNIKSRIDNKANDDDVLKLVAQTLTPQQKNQIMDNLSEMWLSSSGGFFTDSNVIYVPKDTSSRVVIRGGNDFTTGSFIGLYGQDQSVFPGEFILGASNNTLGQQCNLVGKPDGTLTWNNRIIDTVNSFGNTDGSKDYIRFESGWQMCWGTIDWNIPTMTFPQPFRDNKVVVLVGAVWTGSGIPRCEDVYPTYFTYKTTGDVSACWLAIGKWK